MVSAKVEGLERLKAKIAGLSPKIKAAIRPALDKGADELVATMKSIVPVANVDGGELRDSIEKHPGRHELAVVVVAGGPTTTRKGKGKPYDYSRAVEFGHVAEDGSNVPADPFFYTTYRARKTRIRNRIKRAISAAAKAAAAGA